MTITRDLIALVSVPTLGDISSWLNGQMPTHGTEMLRRATPLGGGPWSVGIVRTHRLYGRRVDLSGSDVSMPQRYGQ